MLIRDFCTKNVVTASEEETLFDAAKKMWEGDVGTVVIIDEERVPIGIITDRDVAMKGVALDDPTWAPLKETMAHDIIVLHQDRDLSEAIQIMSEQGIRRIPIVDDDGKLAGILSLDDVMMVFGQGLSQLAGTVAYGLCAPPGKKTGAGKR
ncbi:MAG: CBS domain-containing protein [Candidatus Manganitrophaceae bacterium]|nr:MAG: CBS domain-containing protein [Candidatus Manganitrophaceae bacterium]